MVLDLVRADTGGHLWGRSGGRKVEDIVKRKQVPVSGPVIASVVLKFSGGARDIGGYA